MSEHKVTLQDIAQHAGVSIAAVSQALSGKGSLSQSTRERILHLVEELSYKPDRTAQNLALRRNSQASGKRLSGSKNKRLPPPGVMVFYNLSDLTEVVHLEIQQMEEEGYDVAQYRETLKSWKKTSKKKLYRLYGEVLSAPERADPGYKEPESLPEIQSCRPEGPRSAQISMTPNNLYERIYGAWLGRVAGVVLGKPLQSGWSKSQVIQYLKLADAYPLKNYVPRILPPPPGFEFNPEADGNFLGEIHGAQSDDDTNYSVLALHILEMYGLDFQTADVATEWLGHIPYFGTYTTDRAIYRNLIWNIHPEEAASFVNPEREFIGARTRADIYGYIAPGKPELAAALAYRDAALSHTKNGVYSAMMMAAMISWSFVSDDLAEIIHVGLSEIPKNCRLAEAVQTVLNVHQQNQDWELAYKQLLLKYGTYSPIHSINNTCWVVLALLTSNGDFNRALNTAVVCGMDTGSNAANVGSLMGIIYSQPSIPSQWVEPLNDTLFSGIAQYSENRISELAHRTARIAEMTLTKL